MKHWYDRARIAVIGAGRVARHHLRVLSAMPDCEIVGIANRGGSRIADLGREFSIPEAFDDWRRMVDTTRPDAVLIIVHHEGIFGVTRDCLALGIPSFIEKPPGMSAAQCVDLANAARSRSVLNMVGVNRRFISGLTFARRQLALAGPVHGVSIEWAEGGLVPDQGPAISIKKLDDRPITSGIHPLDLFVHLGGPVAEISVHSGARGARAAYLSFCSGTQGTFLSVPAAGTCFRLSLRGEGVRADFENSLVEGRIILERGTDKTSYAIPVDDVDRRFKPGFWRQHRVFLDSLIRREPLPPDACTLEKAVQTMRLIETIYATSPAMAA